jgi:hypothetical protein
MTATSNGIAPVFLPPRYADAVSMDGGETVVRIPPEWGMPRDGKLALLIRFEMTLEQLAAVLYTGCCAEDISTDKQVLEEAVLAHAIPGDHRVWECTEEVKRDEITGFSWLPEEEQEGARKFLAFCRQRAAEVISGHPEQIAA